MLRITLVCTALIAHVLSAVPAKAQFTKLFDHTNVTNGRYPLGALVSDGTWLYSTASAGGTNNCGTIVRVKLDGSESTLVHTFDFYPSGCYAESRLFILGDYLYGTTKGGGASGFGTIFRMHMDGSGFEKLLDLTSTNGESPLGGLISDGTWLYGTTSAGGQLTRGTIYRIMPDGSGHQMLHQFLGVDGKEPQGELLLVGDTLFGTATTGGPDEWGTIYKMHKDGSGFTLLHAFGDLIDGRFPVAPLYAIGNQLYGIARAGGVDHTGFIYRIDMDGTGFTKIFEFDPIGTGVNVRSSFVYDGTWLYASGPLSDPGSPITSTIFRVKPDGSDFTRLYGLVELEGTDPRNQLLMIGSDLYGTARAGGISNSGTIFTFDLLSTGLATEAAPVGWSLYPNPAHTSITLHWERSTPWRSLEVRDDLGRTVLSRNGTGSNDELVDISGLAGGVYVVVLRDEGGVTTQRFVKY